MRSKEDSVADVSAPKTVKRDAIYDAAKKLSNWGRWGEDDQIGTLNNVSPADIVAAAALIRKGKVFSLALSLKEPIQSGLFGGRWNPIHTMLATGTDAAAVRRGEASASLRTCASVCTSVTGCSGSIARTDSRT